MKYNLCLGRQHLIMHLQRAALESKVPNGESEKHNSIQCTALVMCCVFCYGVMVFSLPWVETGTTGPGEAVVARVDKICP